MYDKGLVTKERLDSLKAARDEMRESGFAAAAKIIGDDGADALRYLYGLYNEGMYLWIAGLWEPEIGGFYFSNSARDNVGFLPDIESTVQAMRFLETAGIFRAKGEGSFDKLAPDNMRAPIIRFAKSLQDPDGFFYHPQWGKDITVSRRARDLGWATNIIRDLGGETNYPTPIDKQPDDGESRLPEHLRSLDAFRAYLDGLDLTHRSYHVGNLLSSQHSQIKAAGDDFVNMLMEWLASQQNPTLGLWQDNLDYHATNGLMKVTMLYNYYGIAFPNARAALESAIAVTLSREPNNQITSFYNPWITMNMLIKNLRMSGDVATADEMQAKIVSSAAEMIRCTADKIRVFGKPDGSFSYCPECSSGTSQGAPVSIPNTPEGDVNGNGLATTGVVRNITDTLGIPAIRFFTPEDGKLFFELIDASYPPVKNKL